MDVQDGVHATQLAGRLTGNEPWKRENGYTVIDGREVAEAQGLVVVTPKPNELQIDIDKNASYDQLWSMYSMVSEFFDITSIHEAKSKSGGEHRHITLTLSNNISDVERILLQAILGSDPKRELLSYIRILRNIPQPTAFFELPEGAQPSQSTNTTVTPVKRSLSASF